MEVILTRARPDGEASAARLATRGIRATLLPVTQIVAMDWSAPEQVDVVVATSRHAFTGFAERAPDERGALAILPLYAVGPATAAAALAAGFRDVRTASGDGRALADLLVSTRARGRALYLAGADRKPTIEAALAGLGLETRLVVAYQAQALDWDAPARRAAARAARAGAGVLHYSRRSAELFLKQIEEAGLDQSLGAFRHFAMSSDAAAPIHRRETRVVVASRPGEGGLFALLAP